MKIAFCGLGRMGVPMAGRLLDAGHDVAVWNRTAGRAAPLVERGARQASSPAAAASDAGVAITMLADPPALDAVVFGPDGISAALVRSGERDSQVDRSRPLDHVPLLRR